jgi:hypothetical protein
MDLTFAVIVVADDYDRSINEAIKVTKYVPIPLPSFVLCVYGEEDGSVILNSLILCTHGICICFSIDRRKQSSPDPMPRREPVAKPEALTNGNHGPSHAAQHQNFGISSPESLDSDDDDDDEYDNTDNLDRRCVVFVSSKYVHMLHI